MNLTITILAPELTLALTALASAIGGAKQVAAYTVHTPVAETPAPVAETPAPVAETPAPVAEAPKRTRTKKPEPAPAAEPAVAVDDAPEPVKPTTKAEVSDLVLAAVASAGRGAVVDALARFGATKVTDLDPAKYNDVASVLRALIGSDA